MEATQVWSERSRVSCVMEEQQYRVGPLVKAHLALGKVEHVSIFSAGLAVSGLYSALCLVRIEHKQMLTGKCAALLKHSS